MTLKYPTNSNYKAAGLILFATFMIVAMNAFAKLLTDQGMSPIEALFYRNLGGLIITLFLLYFLKNKDNFVTKRPKAQFIRAVIGNICLWLVIWANSLLPLATVSAILLLTPIIATALSPIFLKEKISYLRWACVIFGFLGAIIIINPTGQNFDNAMIIALLGAVASAGVIICLRDLGKSENTLTTTFYFLG